MKNVFISTLLLVVALIEISWAGTQNPYYEVENPENGRKFYLFGTRHTSPS